MKWLLIIMLLNGGVTAVPMDSQRACVDAKFKVEATNRAVAVCVQQDAP